MPGWLDRREWLRQHRGLAGHCAALSRFVFVRTAYGNLIYTLAQRRAIIRAAGRVASANTASRVPWALSGTSRDLVNFGGVRCFPLTKLASLRDFDLP